MITVAPPRSVSPQPAAGLAHRRDLRVRGRVGVARGRVHALAQDLPVPDDQGAERLLAGLHVRPRERDGALEKLRLGRSHSLPERSTPQTSQRLRIVENKSPTAATQ